MPIKPTPFAVKFSLAAVGVGEMRIAAIDDQIVLFKMRHEIGDHLVNDRPGGHEQHYVSWRFEFGEEIGKIAAYIERHSGTFL